MTDFRPTWAIVDLDAIRHNVRVLAETARPAQLLTVVKADAYGHGALPVTRAVLDEGVEWLGVALVEEGVSLREAGITARILLLSEPPVDAAGAVVEHQLTPTVYSESGIEALAKAVIETDAETGAHDAPFPVHLKLDTGMHRVGCAPDEVRALVETIDSRPELELEGLWTHLAVADELENPYTGQQLDGFDAVLASLARRPRLVHASNSAGTLGHERARYDLVRCGITLYGIAPAPEIEAEVRGAELRPALSVVSHVSHTKTLPAGSRLSYGLHYELRSDATIATVPIGYADGVPRNLGLTGGEVLIRGRRCPIAGAVTMDQLMVDAGDLDVEPGDEVVLLGARGDHEITASEWAERLGVIGYEVTTRLGPRLPRRYLGAR